MAVKKATVKKASAGAKIAKSGDDFETLMLKIPTDLFVRMVGKSGLPTPEARELCQSFKDLK